MARRKQYIPKGPPMKHLAEFEKYLPESKRKLRRQAIANTHCGFKLINQLPLYRIDDNQTIEL